MPYPAGPPGRERACHPTGHPPNGEAALLPSLSDGAPIIEGRWWMTSLSFAEFIRLTFPGAIVTPLSSTNNEIYKVETGGSVLSAKRMIDSDVAISYFVRCSEILAQSLPIPRIEHIFREADGAAFDCIVSEFVEGHDLAAILSEAGPVRIPDDRLVDLLARYLSAAPRP